MRPGRTGGPVPASAGRAVFRGCRPPPVTARLHGGHGSMPALRGRAPCAPMCPAEGCRPGIFQITLYVQSVGRDEAFPPRTLSWAWITWRNHHVPNPVAPEFRAALEVLPSFDGISDATLDATRKAFIAAIRNVRVRHYPDVTVTTGHVPGPPGAPQVPVVTYRPVASHPGAPALVYIHSGGIVSGTPEVDDARCRQIVSELGMVIFSVDYRLAPEAPIPPPSRTATPS